jgi:hypothetical protein
VGLEEFERFQVAVAAGVQVGKWRPGVDEDGCSRADVEIVTPPPAMPRSSATGFVVPTTRSAAGDLLFD